MTVYQASPAGGGRDSIKGGCGRVAGMFQEEGEGRVAPLSSAFVRSYGALTVRMGGGRRTDLPNSVISCAPAVLCLPVCRCAASCTPQANCRTQAG